MNNAPDENGSDADARRFEELSELARERDGITLKNGALKTMLLTGEGMEPAAGQPKVQRNAENGGEEIVL